MATIVEELEEKIGVIQIELQKVMSRLDKLDMVDFEKLNGVKERLSMIEDGLMNISTISILAITEPRPHQQSQY